MKKLAILLSFLFILTSFVGCSKKYYVGTNQYSVNPSGLKTAEPISDNLSLYRKDITENGGLSGFKPSDLIELIDFKDLDLSDYCYPIIYEYHDTLYLWTTDSYGYVYVTNLESKERNELGDLHHDIENGEKILQLDKQSSITYNPTDGKIHVWEFGKEIESHDLPKESVFCGLSDVGYIFRLGTDIYSFRYTKGIVCIAHNVKSVITTEYYYNPGHFRQPIFLMKNGDIKVYLDDKLYDETIKPDDSKLLCDPLYEGGYH